MIIILTFTIVIKDQKFVFTCTQKLCCRIEDGGEDEEEWEEKWE